MNPESEHASSGARDRLTELRCGAIAGSRGGREVRRHASRYGAIGYSRVFRRQDNFPPSSSPIVTVLGQPCHIRVGAIDDTRPKLRIVRPDQVGPAVAVGLDPDDSYT
jgi:hypothetical protein